MTRRGYKTDADGDNAYSFLMWWTLASFVLGAMVGGLCVWIIWLV